MITKLAVEDYRSLKNIVLELDQITVITGANGSGKSNVYKALRLLAEVVREGALESLVAEGGLTNVLFAGKRPRGQRVALRLGCATDTYSYAIDLGVPQLPAFDVPGVPVLLDPEVKNETMWHGEVLRPSSIIAERRSLSVKYRGDDGQLSLSDMRVQLGESMLAVLASPMETPELFELRELARAWRFYDNLRTDSHSPARQPGPVSFTPVLNASGSNFPGALATVLGTGDRAHLQHAVAEAFDGAEVGLMGDESGTARVCLRQPGLKRPISAAELSDGTLRFLLLATALLSPRPPQLLVLNEPEGSLHPSLLPILAQLIVAAGKRSQIVVVTHAQSLVRALDRDASLIELENVLGATSVVGQLSFEGPSWTWPQR